jgi:hypothetical protein
MDFNPLVVRMKDCIKDHGLWQTVAAVVGVVGAAVVLVTAWRLPDILVALAQVLK